MELRAVYACLVAFAAAAILTPATARLARPLGAVDDLKPRGLARSATPLLGGLAIFAGVLLAALLFLPRNSRTEAIIAGAALITLVGAIDDSRELPPGVKLLGQIAAALILVLSDVTVQTFTLPFLGYVDLQELGGPVTLIGLVTIMNVVNFSDGVDGLAAGVCAISGFTFCLIALSLGRPEPAILAAVVLGACVGFLRHNFYPARIFMGDSGALLLGFVLAALSVQGLLKTAAVATLFFPLIVLAVPIIDTSFVVAKRLKYGRPVYTADRSHLHHRFMNIGFSQRRAAVTMWAWCAVLSGAALALRFLRPHAHGVWHAGPTIGIVAIGAFALAASIYMVYLLEIVKLANPRIRRREQEAREASRRTA
jgi:UDP-GlcNAc:undecaprenyl-phosphate/decaprenyl-phosphate GlcNAc-1-phosphate transferase